MQEESVPEMRLSDIVRGLKVTNKVNMLPLLVLSILKTLYEMR